MISNARIKYSQFDFKFSRRFADVTDSYQDIKLPYINYDNAKRKILFVIDYIPSDDLKTRKLLHGSTGELLDALESAADTFFRKKHKKEKFSWLACSFNAFRTAGRSKEFQQAAKEEFAERVNSIIVRYKPDTVIIFGDQAFKYILPQSAELTDGSVAPWYGTQIDQTIKYGKDEHKCKFFANISLNAVVTGSNPAAAMLGYMSRRLANGLNGYNHYAVDAKRIANHTAVLIDTVAKFDKMLDMLAEQPIVAVDTETKNLNKVTNKLLTIQFAKCLDYGYFVPIYHKDTPFTASELKYILKRLRQFFEGRNKNKYHIYVNANFDLNVLRTDLKCAYMANNVWDIFAGEYAIDENHKFLDSVTGDYYYSLGNIAVQYGFTGYLTAEFGKKHRGSIATTDLTQALIEYGTLDVVAPFAIHEQQIRIAEDIGHVKFKSLVMEQCSDLIHGFSKMSTTGSKLDVDYLFSLQSPSSPIEKVIQEMELGLLSTEAAQKANKLISKSKGIPEKTLFGNLPALAGPAKGTYAAMSTNVLNLRKNDHKHLLFFDVLQLDPVERGASGKGKLDKNFQKKYENVPEVKMYTALEKAKKLKNAFVKSFLKLLGTSEDLKSDHKIRPNYHYLKVVTGRTSASDPNLQQVPSHSELGKHIKRLFVAPEGYLYLKVDYRVHEVRGWGLISMDRGIAELFLAAKKLRDAYRLNPTPELKKRLKAEADIHIMNAAYFFGVDIDKVDKELRNAVKGVIFGLIYQMSMKSLAATLNRSLDYTLELVKNFNKRFPNGMKWIDATKKFAQKHYYYENPLGFRRHLWGYLLPESLPLSGKIRADMDRRAVNSPIQGMCAQFAAIGSRQIDTEVFRIHKEEKRKVDIQVCNSVHDSLENVVAYENYIEAVGIVEEALTTKVRDVVLKRHGFKFVVDLEIDTEVGGDLSGCQAWDTSIVELERIVYESLTFQKNELHYKLDVLDVMEDIFVRQLKAPTAPEWMRKQAKNIGYKFDRSKYKTVKNKK